MAIDPKTWTRSYSYTGYIEPHLDRTNLKVLTNAKAGKILLRKEGDEAVASGVQFFVDGKEYNASAARKVISSAGSAQTPQILELSGIGDRSVLGKHGIKVLVENANVGKNLQDHPMVGISYVSLSPEALRKPPLLPRPGRLKILYHTLRLRLASPHTRTWLIHSLSS